MRGGFKPSVLRSDMFFTRVVALKKSSCVSVMQTAVIRDGFIQEGTTEGAGDLIPLMGAPILKILPGGTVRHEDESIHQPYCRNTGSSFQHFH